MKSRTAAAVRLSKKSRSNPNWMRGFNIAARPAFLKRNVAGMSATTSTTASDLALFTRARASKSLSAWERRFLLGIGAAICDRRELRAEQRLTLEMIAGHCGGQP
jgi:hypothetical protein